MLVDKIMHSKVWSEPGNIAIVITFDENNKEARNSGVQGCCGYDPNSKANFGGGHIATIVITNHGPRHVADPTPYNHYSLLRTTEAAFGITTILATPPTGERRRDDGAAVRRVAASVTG